MDLLVTNNPEQVARVLHNALDRLVLNRLEDGAFTDQEDVSTKGYFSTLEGLEALLIPCVNLPKNEYWGRLQGKHPELFDLIVDDINFILRFNKVKELPPKEQGEPYFEQRKGPKRTPYWTSECSSFALSVLTNFITLRNEFGLSKDHPKDEEIIEVIKKNLGWVNLCKRDNTGWSWTHESPTHHWPTWSLLDTFDEMLDCDSLSNFHKSIEKDCDEVTKTISESFRKGLVAGSYLNDWNEKVLKPEVYDVEAALDLTRLMLAVCQYGNPKIVKPLAKNLFEWAAKTAFGEVDYGFHFSLKADYVYDSSLVPCVFRALNIMAGILKPRKIKEIDDQLGQDHEMVLHRVYTSLTQTLIDRGKYKGLWGVENGGLTYELYYTERAIEALTEFLQHYQDRAKMTTAVDSGKVPPSAHTGTRISRGETARSAQLPVVDEIARQLGQQHGQDLFGDLAIIFVLHFLDDLIPYVESFKSLGCRYEDMFFLVKTYAYPERERLEKRFTDMGCNVFSNPDPHQEAFAALTERILDAVTGSNKNILVVEDGGYFAPKFHESKFETHIEKCVGAVEQTTKGYRRDSTIKTHKFPIYSVATSHLKGYLEAPDVAETLQENIVTVLRERGDRAIYKSRALLLGFGTIGKLLADALDNKGIEVFVYDTKPEKRREAELARKRYSDKVLESTDDLTKFDIVVGLSGETSLSKGEDFWNLKHNVILASGSSERIEFNLETLEALSHDVIRDGIFTKYKTKKEDKVIRLLCDGEPINFALSGGISNFIIDPIYAEMLWAAVDLRTNEKLQPGMHEVSADVEEEVYRLYKKYHL